MTPEQVELLKRTVAVGASDDELAMFLHVCKTTQLDPFVRQIYAVKRRAKNERTQQWEERTTYQVGIDGLRLVAERTGKYRGQTEPEFFDQAGNGRAVWLDTRPPAAVRVGVFREGFREPIYATALWVEFVQKTREGSVTKMWAEKGTLMLAKCAEALALRKAFPQELSALYAPEELMREEVPEVEAEPVRAVVKALPAAAVPGLLTFGVHRDKLVSEVPTAYLLGSFRNPWTDPARRQAAEARLGKAFVQAVYDELDRRASAGDPELAPPREEG
jgi:phage recombination protein Bet